MDSNSKDKVMQRMLEHQQNKKLTSVELADMFDNYLGDSLFICVFTHFLEVVEDDEVRDFIEFAHSISAKHLKILKEIYMQENIPTPVGFGEQDVREDAPRLFSDIYTAFYITEMARGGLVTYSGALTSSTRNDTIDYFEMCIKDTVETYHWGVSLLLSKGVSIDPPMVPYPKKVDFVEKKSFISLVAGKNRPLTAMEIKQLQVNVNTNILGKALMMGFSQVASAAKLRKYFQEGMDLADKQIKQLSNFLVNDDLPTSKTMDAHVTDSIVTPFSDKLMLYHTSLANGIGIQNYGSAIAKVMRHDIHAEFARLSVGIGKYANDGLNITIDNGWLEEPPSAADRDKLSNRGQ